MACILKVSAGEVLTGSSRTPPKGLQVQVGVTDEYIQK